MTRLETPSRPLLAVLGRLGATLATLLLALVVSTCMLGDLVSPSRPGVLSLNPLQVSDSARVGSTAPRTLTVTLTNVDATDSIPWTANITLSSAWLHLNAMTGTAPGTATLVLEPAGLVVGTYRDTIVFSVAGSAVVPVSVPVELRIVGCSISDVAPTVVLQDSLTAADCAAPGRAGRFARMFQFTGTAGDSISVRMFTSLFDAWVVLDTVAGMPPLAQNDNCLAGANDPCLAYILLPRTGPYFIEATSNVAGATGLFRLDVLRPRPPTAPDTLRQMQTDLVTPVGTGGAVDIGQIVLRATVSDPDFDSSQLQVELRPVGTAFTNAATSTSALVGTGQTAALTFAGLTDDASYHWQARTLDRTGRTSAWLSFGGNAESAADFRINVPQTPPVPTALAQLRNDGTTAIAVGGTNDDNTTLFQSQLTDPDPGDQLRLEIEIRPLGTAFTNAASGSSTPVAVGGTATATIAGLSDNVSYHWQARTVDQTGRASAWTPFGGNAESAADLRIAIAPSRLTFTVQPANAGAGAAIAPAVLVAAQDAGGTTLTSFAGTITVALGTNSGGGTLSGTVSAAAVAGVATFANLSIDKAATGYTLLASGAALAGTSAAFTITPGPARRLAWQTQPANGTAGGALAATVVAALDSLGNTATAFTGTVQVALGANPGGATLGGTAAAAATAGVATFGTLTLNRSGTGYTLTAGATGLTGATSTPFDVVPGVASALLITQQPPAAAASGVALIPQPVVRLQDASGNNVLQAGVGVTANLTSAPAGASLSGTAVSTDATGTATFATLTIAGPAGSYGLTFTSGSLAPAPASTVTLGAGSATRLLIATQPSSSAASGVAFGQQPAIQAHDAAGNPVAQAGIVVNASIASGGGTLGGVTAATTDGAGLATFGNLSITGVAGARTLGFAATGLAGATSSTVTIGAGSATQIAAQAGTGQSAVAGAPVGVAPAVLVLDGNGNPVAGVDVTFAVTGGGGTVVPTTAVQTGPNGIASATSWTLGTTAGANTLQASSGTLTGSPVTFTATGTAGPADSLAKSSGDNLTGPVGTTLGTPHEVLVTDANGNPVSGATVNWAAASGGGSVNPSSSVTDAAGHATTTRTLDPVAGPHTTTATVTISGAPVTVTFTLTATVGGAAKMFAQAGDNQTDTVGATLATPLAVLVTDANDNPVANVTVTWTVIGGGGSLLPASGPTNAQGIATTVWTLGTSTASLQGARASAGPTPVNFFATANPGTVNAALTSVSAAPGTITAGGAAATITVTARDGFGNVIPGKTVTLAATGSGNTIGDPAAPTDASGMTTGSFASTAAGQHTVSATVGGVLVTQQPVVTVVPGGPSVATSLVGVSSGSVASGSGITVTLQSKDASGNNLTTGGATVVFSHSGGASTGTFGATSDQGNGSYSATFTGVLAGSATTIGATIGGTAVASTQPMTVTPGPIAVATSTVGVQSGTIASGSATILTLTARDAAGNALAAGGSTVAFTRTGGTSTGVIGATSDPGTGSYTATFTGVVAGTATTIGATIGGIAVTTAGPTITVTPGPVSTVQSAVSVSQPGVQSGGTSTITLRARDAAGNNITTGGLAVGFGTTGGTSTGTIGAVADSGNGVYTAVFTGQTVGTPLTITATINATTVTSALPTISVSPGLASVATSLVTVVGGGTTVQSGSTLTVQLQARDAANNLLTAGGEGVAFSLSGGTSTAQFTAATDNGDGSYTATLTGDIAGTASQVHATINGSAVTTAAPDVTVTPRPQTITFAPPTTPAEYGSSFGVAPTASSALTVSVGATGGCSMAGLTVTMTSGTADCTLTASQPGDGRYAAATDVVHVVAASTRPASVTPNATGKIFGGVDPALTGSLTGFLAGDNVTATYARTAGENVGSYTISATLSPPAVLGNYAITANTAAFTIAPAGQNITFVQPVTPATFGTSFAVAPTASSGLAVTVLAAGGCSITSGTVTMTSGTADCVLTASQAGDANYTAATDEVRTVAAALAGQSITFTQPASPAEYNTTFGVAPAASSGLTVTVLATGGCSITSGTVTMTSGTADCVLTASQAGNTDYSAATDVVRTVAASTSAQAITFAQPTSPATFGTTFGVAPTASSGLAVSVLATGGCSINAGTVTMTSGTTDCVLTASQAGDANFSAATDAVRTVAAALAGQSITFVQPPSPAAFGSTFGVAPTASSGLAVSVLAAGGCSINAGTVTMTSGTTDCVLTASQAGNADYSAATDEVRTVAAALAGQSITFAQPASPATFGTTFGVAPTASSGLAVTVLATGGCSFNAGTVTMTSGTADCVLTASQAGDANFSAAGDEVRTVAAALAGQSITFAQPASPAEYNATFGVAPTASSGLTVTVLATGGCTINSGTVTMTSSTADCVLTASQAGDANYSAATDEVRTVAASIAAQSITFAQPASPATFGTTFGVAPTASSGLTVSVLATGGCSINAGTVTMTSGTTDCVLTASQAGNANYSAATDVVRTVAAALAGQSITFAQPTTPAEYNSTFGVAPTASSGLTVTVLATGGCSVNSGTVTMTSSTADCVLTASQGGNANYSAATDEVRTVAATLANQSITFTQPASPATFGSTFGVAPTASSGLTVTVLATGGCTINSGTVTMTSGTADCVLTASQAGDADYNAATDVVRTVAAALAGQSITFAQPTTPATFGSTFGVAPTASSGLTVTVLATGGCSINSGTVTMTSGTTDCDLAASQAGDANYSAATGVVRTVLAAKAAQAAVTLTPPADDSIGAANLVAVAGGGSAGAFSYASTTPAVCTIHPTSGAVAALTLGTCSLTATRAGDADYLAETSAVQSFSVTAGAAAQLAFTTQPPASAAAGGQFTIVVQALDSHGNLATTYAANVSLAAAGGGGGALFGSATEAASAGVATFTGINVHTAGTGYTIDATATGLTSTTSTSFDIVAGNAHHLAFTTNPPASDTAGALFTVVVELQDVFNNRKTNFDDVVNLSLSGGTASANLGGTLTGTTSSGVATFTGLFVDSAGSGYQVVADFPNAPVAGAASTTFAVTPGNANTGTSLVSVSAPTVQITNSVTITLQLKDAFGNSLTTDPGVAVVFSLSNGIGESQGTITAATYAGNGQYTATFTGTLVGSPATISATIDAAAVTSTTTIQVTL